MIEKKEKEGKVESIYLKLPLVENVEELKKNVILELKEIFSKYGINGNYLNDFLGKISCFKTNLFELSFNSNKNNSWNSIQALKNDFVTLKDKGVSVLIVLDDIEREDDANKIKKSIYFLGELAEYFRNTTTVILFLAEYKKIIEKLEEEEIKDNEKKYDERLLDKYFSYVIKVGEVDLEELTDEDINTLLGKEMILSKKYEIAIVDILKKFSKIYKIENERFYNYSTKEEKYPIQISENIRNIKRFLKKVGPLSTWLEYESTAWLAINIINILEIFIEVKKENGKKEEELKEKLKEKLFNEIMISYNKTISYNLVKWEIKKIENFLERGKKIPKDFIIKIEKVLKIIDGKLNLEEKISLDVQEENYIFEYIKNDKEKLNNLLKSNIIVNKDRLKDKIFKMNLEDLNFLSKASKEKIKSMLLIKKISSLEEEARIKEEEREYYLETIREDNLSIQEKVENYKKINSEKIKKVLSLIEKEKIFEEDLENIKAIYRVEFEEDTREYNNFLQEEEEERRRMQDGYF